MGGAYYKMHINMIVSYRIRVKGELTNEITPSRGLHHYHHTCSSFVSRVSQHY
jgi:hypothetical protein